MNKSNFKETLAEKLKIKGSVSKVKQLKAKAKNVTQKFHQVMCKVTGYGSGAKHVKAGFDYISRNGEVKIENERGEVFKDKEEIRSYGKEFVDEFQGKASRVNQRDTMKMVLSMNGDVSTPDGVKNATRDFAKENFANHEYVFALHTDTENPHCHLIVKCKGVNGERLGTNPIDLERYRDSFAKHLMNNGIDAENTYRAERGVVKREYSQVIHHIEKGSEKRLPRISIVSQKKLQEAVKEASDIFSGGKVAEKPWEAVLKSHASIAKSNWLAVARLIKENVNEPLKPMVAIKPEYGNYDQSIIKRVQWEAAVYQSRNRATIPKSQARAIASLRDLPRKSLVSHFGGTIESILHTDALNSLEQAGNPYHGLRRSGVGIDRARSANAVRADGSSGINSAQLVSDVVELARSIGTEKTRHQELVRELVRVSEAQKASGQQKEATPWRAPKPTEPSKDVER